MARILADLILETTSTTGTGAITLLGAQTGYRTFASVMATGDTAPYRIGTPGEAVYEIGIGTMQADGKLARTTIIASSNGNAVVNLPAGTRDIYLTAPANDSYLRKDGDTATGPLTLATTSKVINTNGEADLRIDGKLNSAAFVQFQKAATSRWLIGAHSDAESTGNAGSNLVMMRFADNGGYLSIPLSINRSDGIVNVSHGLSALGTGITTTSITASGTITAPRHSIDANGYYTLSGALPILAFDANDYFSYNRTSDTLALVIGGSTRFAVHSGAVTCSAPCILQASQSTNANAAVHKSYVDNTFLAKTGGTLTGDLVTGYGTLRTVNGIHRNDHTSDGWSETWSTANGARAWTSPSATLMSLEPTGTLNISGGFGTSHYNGLYQSGYQSINGSYVVYSTNCNPAWETVQTQAIHIPNVWAGYRIVAGTTAPKAWEFRDSGHAYSNGSWIDASDGRVKVDRAVLTDALDRVETLTGYTYTRTDLGNQRDAGLIAQDVREVLPEVVHAGHEPIDGGEGFLHLNYNGVTALLVEALKELRAEVKTLRAIVDQKNV